MIRVLVLLFLASTAYCQMSGAIMYLNRDFEFSFRDSARYYRKGDMELGFPVGEVSDYYLSGQLYMSGRYNHEYEPEGVFEWYYESGKKKEKGVYEEGEYKIVSFWDDTGNRTVKKGHGRAVYYYENGTKKAEGYFEKGKKAGLWLYYYRDGSKAELHEYKDGVFTMVSAWNKKGVMTVENGTGKYETYYSNGVIKTKGQYKHGFRDGKWTWNFSNGKIERQGDYVEGREEGTHTLFYNNGIFRYKWNYQAGRLHGVYIKYHKNGRISQSCEYKDGEQASVLRRYDEYGNRIPQEDSGDDHSHWQNFNSRIVKTTYF